MKRVIITMLFLSTLSAGAATRHVALSGTHTSPYTNWVTAATSLLAVVTGSQNGDTILVTDGVWKALSGPTQTSLVWRSVNGPDKTTIDGTLLSSSSEFYGGTNGEFHGFTFCNTTGQYGTILIGRSYLISNCIVTRVKNTRSYQGAITFFGSQTSRVYNTLVHANFNADHGGGVSLSGESGSPIVYMTDCVVSNNDTPSWGGGVCAQGGTLYMDRCTITRNTSARGAGCFASSAGGVVLSNCVVSYNHVDVDQGALYNAVAYNSFLFGNWDGYCAASWESVLYNCVAIGNFSSDTRYGSIYFSKGENNIFYYNYPADVDGGAFSNTCYRVRGTTAPTMINCLSNVAPVFVDDYAAVLATPSAANCGTGFSLLASGLDGLRLQASSPLINSGTNKGWMVGTFDYSATNARIQSVSVDLGPFELVPLVAPPGANRPWGLKALHTFGLQGGVFRW